MSTEEINHLVGKYMDQFIQWLPSAALAILIIFIGLFIVKYISRLLNKSLERLQIDREIKGFLQSLLSIVLKGIVFLIGASVVGFEFSALIGLLAAAGFAVGLALQGFMGNFASGLTIIFFKPYKIGDWVEISSKFGKVEDIQLFNTHLSTPNNKKLIVPNGQVTDNIITNFSDLGYIRLELNVLTAYEESFPRLKEIITKAIQQSDYILKDHEILVGIETYDTHNVLVAVRPAIEPNYYWEAVFNCNALIKKALHDAGIKMAYSEGVELGPIGP